MSPAEVRKVIGCELTDLVIQHRQYFTRSFKQVLSILFTNFLFKGDFDVCSKLFFVILRKIVLQLLVDQFFLSYDLSVHENLI